MKNYIKFLGVLILTMVFVACGGAEVSFAPSARADEPASAGTAGQPNTGGSSSTSCTCEPGSKGDQGSQGPAGPQGSPGKDGTSVVCVNDLNSCPPGVPGVKGDAGPAGPQGLKGAAGLDGADGKNGAAGPVGPQGAVGPAGASGQAGATGPAGPKGADGKDGISLTKDSLYVRNADLSVGTATALCDDENDVAITGNCLGQNIIWAEIGVYQPTSANTRSGWNCRSANVGGNPIGATVVCLGVP